MGLLSAFRRLRVRIAGGRKRSAESDPEENGACHHRRAYAVPDQENTAERSSDATKESVAHALWNPGGHKISGSAEPLSLGTTRVLEINTTLSCRADARAPSEPCQHTPKCSQNEGDHRKPHSRTADSTAHTAPCPRSHPVCSIHPSASQSGDHSCESPCCPQAPRVSPLTPGLVRGLPSRLETRDPQELSLEDQASCSTSTEMVPTKLDCDLKRARPRTLHKARSSPAIPYKAPMEEIPPCPTWTEITPVNGDCVAEPPHPLPHISRPVPPPRPVFDRSICPSPLHKAHVFVSPYESGIAPLEQVPSITDPHYVSTFPYRSPPPSYSSPELGVCVPRSHKATFPEEPSSAFPDTPPRRYERASKVFSFLIRKRSPLKSPSKSPTKRNSISSIDRSSETQDKSHSFFDNGSEQSFRLDVKQSSDSTAWNRKGVNRRVPPSRIPVATNRTRGPANNASAVSLPRFEPSSTPVETDFRTTLGEIANVDTLVLSPHSTARTASEKRMGLLFESSMPLTRARSNTADSDFFMDPPSKPLIPTHRPQRRFALPGPASVARSSSPPSAE